MELKIDLRNVAVAYVALTAWAALKRSGGGMGSDPFLPTFTELLSQPGFVIQETLGVSIAVVPR